MADYHALHNSALKKTGFYGAAGAGCLIFSKDSKRFLINHRSKDVEQPHTWGTWGGAIDPREDVEQAVRREIREEAGYRGPVDLIPIFVFKKDDFRYFNFIAVVEEEFEPILDWESQGYRWCEFGQWPSPIHFGLKAILADAESVATMKTLLRDDVVEHLVLRSQEPAVEATDDGLRIIVTVGGNRYQITHNDGFWNITTDSGVEVEGRGRSVDEALEMILRSL